MLELKTQNVSALCVTNRPIFVPNILRQWRRTRAECLIVVVDYSDQSKKVLPLFDTQEMRELGGINYQPKVSNLNNIPIIEWDNVKVVVAIGQTTIGYCRNLAMRFTDTNYITWIDDDDLQLENRVPDLICYTRKTYDIKNKTHILIKGGVPLIDAGTQQVKMRPRSLSWREGIYFRPLLKPFPGINIGEDYHWTAQFRDDNITCTRVQYPEFLAVDIKHPNNVSDVRSISVDPSYWEGGLEGLDSIWVEAFKVWQADLSLGKELAAAI